MTTEVLRLLDVHVEVEGPPLLPRVCALHVLEVPVVSPRGKMFIRLVHVGQHLPLVCDPHDLPAVVPAGESDLGLDEAGEGAGVEHHVVLVHGAVQAHAAEHEVDGEVCELTDRAGEDYTGLVCRLAACTDVSNTGTFVRNLEPNRIR